MHSSPISPHHMKYYQVKRNEEFSETHVVHANSNKFKRYMQGSISYASDKKMNSYNVELKSTNELLQC